MRPPVRFHQERNSMIPGYNRYARCPCGSGDKAKFCCNWTEGHWNKKPAFLTPTPSDSGHNVKGCYLAFTNNCGGRLSLEHYVSHEILKSMSPDGMSTVSGFRWLPEDQFTRVPSALLASKVLCSRHNSALSPLDTAAANLKELIRKYDDPTALEDRVTLFAGEDIERWMLKVLCGFVVSGQARDSAIQTIDSWSRVLAGDESWPREWGLYVVPNNFQHSQHFRFETFVKHNNEFVGAAIPLNNLPLVFLMPDRSVGGAMYRPRYIHFTVNGERRTIILTWEDQGRNGFIEFTQAERTMAGDPNMPNYPTKEL